MEALSGAGIPIYAESGRNGGIYLLHHFVLERALLPESERQDVLTAVQGFSPDIFPDRSLICERNCVSCV